MPLFAAQLLDLAKERILLSHIFKMQCTPLTILVPPNMLSTRWTVAEFENCTYVPLACNYLFGRTRDGNGDKKL